MSLNRNRCYLANEKVSIQMDKTNTPRKYKAIFILKERDFKTLFAIF